MNRTVLKHLRCCRKTTLLLPTVVALLSLGPTSAVARAQTPGAGADRPNIIYIVLDDAGYSDFGPYGSEISTPNIDRLAEGGIRYNSFETRAVCSPTRAALLTGRNNQAVGMMDLPSADRGYAHSRGYITPAAATIAEILQANGYRTSLAGKWHLTPPAEMPDSVSTRANWPSGKGFQNFYGWLIGWTDQYNPTGVGREMIEGNHPVATPIPPGYHVSEAIVTRAIEYLKEGFATAPEQPAFLLLSFGAPHYPIQVPREYIDRYAGVYEKGWDRIRQERFARQKEIGLIPPDAVLPARLPEDAAWDDLTSDEQTVFARFMAAYAGFVEHADEQIGRLLEYLEEAGQYENTVIFLLSDNGATPEGGDTGRFGPGVTTVAEMLERLDDLGTERSSPYYQRPWAMVSNTPFQRYKASPYAGGTRDPLIVSWPAGIRDGGAIRSQFVEAIDITPTVLDILQIESPAELAGIAQMPMHGRSILPTFTDPSAPTRTTQFFVIRGNRAIVHDGWKAIAIHESGGSFDDDRWELYHTARDFSQAFDVSAEYPEKLRELQALWWSEAEKYGGLPLIESTRGGGPPN